MLKFILKSVFIIKHNKYKILKIFNFNHIIYTLYSVPRAVFRQKRSWNLYKFLSMLDNQIKTALLPKTRVHDINVQMFGQFR